MTKICLGVLVSVLACEAQSTWPLRGEVRAAVSEDLSWLTVRLDPATADRHGESASVSVTGDFSFPGVGEGIYTLRVTDRLGNEITSQPLTVGQITAPIEIRLPQQPSERPTGETISVARLHHRPTRQALEASRKAQQASARGDQERAAIEWKRAVNADPEFSQGHGNLGVAYARLDRVAEAIEEFRQAIALDRFTAGYQSDLALMLSKAGQMDEAESWARSAVSLENANSVGHYILGCVLAMRAARLSEAVRQLQLAAPQYPGAHRVLASIYQAQGRMAMAAAETKEYNESLMPGDAHGSDSIKSFHH